MNRRFQHVPLAGLLITAAIVLAGSSQTFIAAGAICFITVLFLLGLRLNAKPRVFVTLVLMVPFALWGADVLEETQAQINPSLMVLFIGGYYAVTVGLYQLLCCDVGARLGNVTGAAIVGVALAATADRNPIFLPGFVMFMALLLWSIRADLALVGQVSDRTRWYVFRIAAIALAAKLAFLIQTQVLERDKQIDRWVQQMIGVRSPHVGPGFSRSATLGSVESFQQDGSTEEIVLRCFGPNQPQYLRGAVYDRFANNQWSPIKENREILPDRSERGRGVFLMTGNETPENAAHAYVYHAGRDLRDTFFIPSGAGELRTFAERVSVSRGYTARPTRGESLGGYEYILMPEANTEPHETEYDVPTHYRLRLGLLLKDIVTPDATPRQQMDMIRKWFHENFTYKLGIEIAPGEEPLFDFLERIKAGHCEYYASAATLMLRTLGVPARYATGFVAAEPGPNRMYWVARRKDAHAWVEVYLQGEGWVVFEPTPPDAMPQPKELTDRERWKDAWNAYWDRFTQILRVGGVRALIGIVWYWITAAMLAVPYWVWTIIIVAGVAWTYRQPLLTFVGLSNAPVVPGHIRELQRLLAQAERMLARHRIYRDPAMTASALRAVVVDADLPNEVRDKVLPLLDRYESLRFRAPGSE